MDTVAPVRPDVFDRLYRQHRAQVYRWALRYGAGRSAWAEDLTHEVFLRLFAHLADLEREEDLEPWLYRATVNLALNQLRNERSWVRRLASLLKPERDERPGPERQVSQRELLLKTIERLPPKEYLVLCMKVLDGKEQRDIAATLGWSEGYVSKLAARAWAQVARSGWEVPDGSP